jgi:glycosyltransferase involved in cell wall biosynthesis
MKTHPRILIVSSGNPCRNPRPYKEALTLGRAGYDVTLLAPSGGAHLDALDADLLKGAPFALQTLPTRSAFLPRLRPWLARRAVRLGLHSVHALGNPDTLLRRVRELPAGLTIVHNEIPHWIGTRLLAEGRRVAADLEDWHSEDLLPSDRRHRPLRLLRAVEKNLLHHARYVTTTSHALAGALHARYGGTRPEVITNAFPLDPASALARPSADSPPAFFWFSQTLGPGRGLERFLDAWVLTRAPSRVVFVGKPVSGYEHHLRARLPENFRDRLTMRPLVPPAELPALIAAHDIGLALEDASIRNRDLTITNKILQYLNAGLALLATDTAGQREVLAHAPEAGLIAPSDDASSYAAVLDTLAADPTRLRQRQQAARRLAEDVYCWENEAPRLLALVEKALR